MTTSIYPLDAYSLLGTLSPDLVVIAWDETGGAETKIRPALRLVSSTAEGTAAHEP